MSDRQYADGKLRTPQELAREAWSWGTDLPGVVACSRLPPWELLELLRLDYDVANGAEFAAAVRLYEELHGE